MPGILLIPTRGRLQRFGRSATISVVKRWAVSGWLVLSLAVPLQAEHAGKLREQLRVPIRQAIDANYAEALLQFQRFEEEHPEHPLLQYYIGLCHFYLKESEDARRYLGKSVENRADFPEAFYWLAQVYLAEDEEEPALEILEKGVDKFPANKNLKGLLANLKQKMGND